jgi:hypothetical protein
VSVLDRLLGRKPPEVVEEPKEPKTMLLSSDDDMETRAAKALQVAGMCLNQTAWDHIIPGVARVLRAYRELDDEAKEQT